MVTLVTRTRSTYTTRSSRPLVIVLLAPMMFLGAYLCLSITIGFDRSIGSNTFTTTVFSFADAFVLHRPTLSRTLTSTHDIQRPYSFSPKIVVSPSSTTLNLNWFTPPSSSSSTSGKETKASSQRKNSNQKKNGKGSSSDKIVVLDKIGSGSYLAESEFKN